jgi:membrane protease YdiL (CAAX protease family)
MLRGISIYLGFFWREVLTPLVTYVSLAIFPVLSLLRPDPIQIRWGMQLAKQKMPFRPLPPHLKERSDQIDRRYLRFFQSGVMCASIYFLMRRYSVSATAVGLRFDHLSRYLALGAAAGTSYLIYLRLVRMAAAILARRPIPYQPVGYLTRGSAMLWVFGNILGCFAEEYWRAFCLFSVMVVGYEQWFAVLATSIAFAFAHYWGHRPTSFQLGYLSAAAAFGVFFALLLLWSNSIVVTYSGHLMVNLVALYRSRRATARVAATSAGSLGQ